jgi:hypothetical protein
LKNYCFRGRGGKELQIVEKGETVKEKKRDRGRQGRVRWEKGGQREERKGAEGREEGRRRYMYIVQPR